MSPKTADSPPAPRHPGPAWRTVRPQDRDLHRLIPYYYRRVGGNYLLYKPAGLSLEEMGHDPQLAPETLYYPGRYHQLAIEEVQAHMLGQGLALAAAQEDWEQVCLDLLFLVEGAFEQPGVSLLRPFKPLLEQLTRLLCQQPQVLRHFALISGQGLSLAEHSVAVMALAAGYGIAAAMKWEAVSTLALAGLLHDVGKANMTRAISQPARKLTDAEFHQMRRHPQEGVKLLADCGFDPSVREGILQHHERLDGSGYPKGISVLGPTGKVMALIDSYQNLTSEHLRYRQPLTPLATLELLKDEVTQFKFDPEVFRLFAHSLA